MLKIRYPYCILLLSEIDRSSDRSIVTNLLNGIANLSLFLYPYLRNMFCNDDPPVLCVFANAYGSISDGLLYYNYSIYCVKKKSCNFVKVQNLADFN